MNNFKAGKYSFNSNNLNRIEFPLMNNYNNNKIPLFKPNKKFLEKFFLSFPHNSILNNKVPLQKNNYPFHLQESNSVQNTHKYNLNSKDIIYKRLNIVSSTKQNLLNNQFLINKETNNLNNKNY